MGFGRLPHCKQRRNTNAKTVITEIDHVYYKEKENTEVFRAKGRR